MPTQATTKWGARGCTNSSADYGDQTIADRVVLGSHLSVAWVGYKVIDIEATSRVIEFNALKTC